MKLTLKVHPDIFYWIEGRFGTRLRHSPECMFAKSRHVYDGVTVEIVEETCQDAFVKLVAIDDKPLGPDDEAAP